MRPRKLLLTLTLIMTISTTLSAQQLPSAIAPAALNQDPAPDKANPALIDTFQLPSHGELLNAFVYVTAGAGPHPTVLLLHGFPGNERNLDLAQSLRRAGYNVLYFNYRGAWGSPGNFSFTHAIEDTQAAIAYLRDPANAKRLRTDPTNLILIGHSMGGMIAAYVASQDQAIRAVGLISAADMAGRVLPAVKAGRQAAALPHIAASLAAEGLAPLAGCTPEGLAQELLANAATWDIRSLAPKLVTRPVLILTSDDGGAAPLQQLATNLTQLGDTHVASQHLATDHSYSDHRIALQVAVLNFLAHADPR
jgi:pimeloyl-ACP methyl ester carboxylesterase